MAAEPSSTAKVRSTAQIAEAAKSWEKTASRTAEDYASLAKQVAELLPASLLQAGLDVNAATDMTNELRINLSNFGALFAELADQAKAIQATRDDILQLVAKAKSNVTTERQFKVGA